MAEAELCAHNGRADGVDQGAMLMFRKGHAFPYQRAVETSSVLSLIANARLTNLLLARMELGKRIEAAYVAKGLNQRQAAIQLGWSAQRLANYVNGRAPDLASLLKIANEFDTTPNDLLGISGQSDSELLDILRRLLELEGLPAPRAGMIAEVAQASLRQLQRLPGDHAPELPAAIAQTIWTERSELASDRSPRP